MSRKRHAKELIEILLKQQRENRPQGNNPLEGIEWEGLPPELQDKVYKPKEKKEPLIEFLTSPLAGGEREEEKKERPRTKPGLFLRAKALFFDLYGILVKTYEVRVVTFVAFAFSALLVTLLAYMVGLAKGRSQLPFLEARGSADSLAIVGPVHKESPSVRAISATKTAIVSLPKPGASRTVPAVEKKRSSSKKGLPQSTFYSIGVATVPTEDAARQLCRELRDLDLSNLNPRYYRTKGGWFVFLGAWPGLSEAREKLLELKEQVFRRLQEKGLINKLDQYVFKNISRR